jgi:hypothetical protein
MSVAIDDVTLHIFIRDLPETYFVSERSIPLWPKKPRWEWVLEAYTVPGPYDYLRTFMVRESSQCTCRMDLPWAFVLYPVGKVLSFPDNC